MRTVAWALVALFVLDRVADDWSKFIVLKKKNRSGPWPPFAWIVAWTMGRTAEVWAFFYLFQVKP
jgi:hypothetical protein